MLYFVGGSPRTGKTILGQQVSAKLRIGWISTDLLEDLLRVKNKPSHMRGQLIAHFRRNKPCFDRAFHYHGPETLTKCLYIGNVFEYNSENLGESKSL